MTVANIPIVSALARSMPISLATAPRKILPPPMTNARSQPISLTSLISCGKGFDGFRVDTEVQRTGEHFAGNFENDPFIFQRCDRRSLTFG